MLLLGLVDMPLSLIFIVTIVTAFYFYTSRKHSLFSRYGIPAITPTPFIGGLPYLAKKGIMQSEYEATMKYGKCVGFFLGNMPTVFLTDPEIIREIFVKRFTEYPNRSQAAYITHFWEKTLLWTTKYNNWKFLRSTLSPSFSSGKLRKMDTTVVSCVNTAIDQLQMEMKDTGTVVDVVPFFQGITLDVICQSAMGVKLDSGKSASNELRQHISRLLHFSLEKNPWLVLLFIVPDLRRIMALFDIDFNDTTAINFVKKCLVSIVQERKQDKMAAKYQDILQLMINTNLDQKKENKQDCTDVEETNKHPTHENQAESTELEKPSRGMTDDEIIANAIMFMFAGYDTTSTAMIFASYFLATQQDCQEKIWNEIKEKIGTSDPDYDSIQQLNYLDMFVSESMRLYPPVTRINRNNYRDTTIGQYTFPKGISITVPVFTLHRMSEFWPDPEKFDPERFLPQNRAKMVPYTYLPFGTGPRNCVGLRFANMELKITIVKLLQKFRIQPSEALHIPPKLEKNVFCRPVGGMKLLLEQRR